MPTRRPVSEQGSFESLTRATKRGPACLLVVNVRYMAAYMLDHHLHAWLTASQLECGVPRREWLKRTLMNPPVHEALVTC